MEFVLILEPEVKAERLELGKGKETLEFIQKRVCDGVCQSFLLCSSHCNTSRRTKQGNPSLFPGILCHWPAPTRKPVENQQEGLVL